MRYLSLLVPVLAMAAAAAPPAAAQDAAAGAKLFARCQLCHQIDAAKGSGLGPNLAGVVGRKAGTFARFSYSPALARSGIVWTKETLEAFLANPQKLVPGNRMAFAGVPAAQERADLIAFLATK